MVAWEIVLGDDAKTFRKPKENKGPEPYGSPFGNPLLLLLDLQLESCRQGSGSVVDSRGRHLMVPELYSGATEVVPKSACKTKGASCI